MATSSHLLCYKLHTSFTVFFCSLWFWCFKTISQRATFLSFELPISESWTTDNCINQHKWTEEKAIDACNETNLMHYLPSFYSVTIRVLLQVLGLRVAHHQEVALYICNIWYVLYLLFDCQLNWQSNKRYNTYQLSHIYIATSWWWATRKPKTCRSIVRDSCNCCKEVSQHNISLFDNNINFIT
jgi:hypothetical protein